MAISFQFLLVSNHASSTKPSGWHCIFSNLQNIHNFICECQETKVVWQKFKESLYRQNYYLTLRKVMIVTLVATNELKWIQDMLCIANNLLLNSSVFLVHKNSNCSTYLWILTISYNIDDKNISHRYKNEATLPECHLFVIVP
jgi:hypothetical protein